MDGIKVSFSTESRIQASVILGLLVIHANGIAATKKLGTLNTFLLLLAIH